MIKHLHCRKNPLRRSGSGASAKKAINVGLETLKIVFIGKHDL